MFVLNFKAINHVTLVLEPENPPESLAEKAVALKNGLGILQKIFHTIICFKIPFYPYQPTFSRHESFSFFFFFLNLVRSSSLKPQSIEI